MVTLPSEIEALVDFIRALRKLVAPTKGVAILFTCVKVDSMKVWGKGIETMQMTDIQQALAHIEATDAEDNPASFDAPLTWTSSDPSIVLVEPTSDGMSAIIKSPSPGPLGSAMVTASGQSGGQTFQGTLAVDIVGSAAVKINITTEEPTP